MSSRYIPAMIPVAGSANSLKDHGCLDLTGADERELLVLQHDLDNMEEPGFDDFIAWAIEQREARRKYLHAQCTPIFHTVL